MSRGLFLLAAVPLIAAGYFVRDSDLVGRATLYAEAFLLGSGGTDVTRPEVPDTSPRHVSLPASAAVLFKQPGKQARADRLGAPGRRRSAGPRASVMVASLSPASDAASRQGPGQVRTPGLINRDNKDGRLDSQTAGRLMLARTGVGEPDPEDLPENFEGASAAIFMLSPTADAAFVDAHKMGEGQAVAWPGRLHLASLKADDATKLFGGFTEEEFRARELRCMTAAIYFEARSEPQRGQIAVAQVVMNRVRASAYPDTICGVIYQGQWNRNACQFSFACDGLPERPENKALWKRSMSLAREVMRGKHWLSEIGYATHYHATYVKPRWARYFERVKQIGQHIFYKAPKIRVRVADTFDLD